MPQLHIDFLGPFVECNGAINRCMESNRAPVSPPKSARPVAGTPTVRVKLENGTEQIWHDCGSTTAYKQARETLTESDFKFFVAMAAGFSVMSSGKSARLLYPEVARNHPTGHVDHHSASVREHLAESKRLQQAYFASIAIQAVAGLDEKTAKVAAASQKIRKAIL